MTIEADHYSENNEPRDTNETQRNTKKPPILKQRALRVRIEVTKADLELYRKNNEWLRHRTDGQVRAVMTGKIEAIRLSQLHDLVEEAQTNRY